MPETPNVTAADRYAQLEVIRQPYLDRARKAAEVTLPYLFPPSGTSGASNLPEPFSSIGARGVNNLASKLLMALFPPNLPFFDLGVDDFTLARLAAEAGTKVEDLRGEIATEFGSITRAVSQKVEKSGRSSAFEGLKQLLVGGNTLLQVLPNDKYKVHKLTDYCVVRDGEGEPIEIVVKENLVRASAPQRVLDALEQAPSEPDPEDPEAPVELYTWIRLQRNTWQVHQEVEGQTIEGSQGQHPKDKSPWIPLCFVRVSGEHYGRGHIEEYIGDLLTHDALMQAIIDFSGAASKVVDFVDPGGVTDAEEYRNARSGDVLEGNANDITTKQLDKYADFRVTDEVATKAERRLEQAFLLMSSITRDAERVTATEIQRLADELETALGGVYSLLAEEFQAPLARRLLHQMDNLPKLPMKDLTLQVVTGVEALGRNAELFRLEAFIRGMVEVAGPESVSAYLNLEGYMKRRAKALSIDPGGLIRTDAEVQQKRQEAMMQQALAQGSVQFMDNRASEAAAASQTPNTGVPEA